MAADSIPESVGHLYQIMAHILATKVSPVHFRGLEDAFRTLEAGIQNLTAAVRRLEDVTGTVAEHLKELKLDNYCALRLRWQTEVPQYQLKRITLVKD